jgi:hypothetical protein
MYPPNCNKNKPARTEDIRRNAVPSVHSRKVGVGE